MKAGWIRDWTVDSSVYFAAYNADDMVGADAARRRRAGRTAQRRFRRSFTTTVFADATTDASVATLPWGHPLSIDVDEYPVSLSGRALVTFEFEGAEQHGWVARSAIAFQAYVQRPQDPIAVVGDSKKLQVPLRRGPRDGARIKSRLLWGDPLQVIRRSGSWIRVAARGWQGWVQEDHVGETALLEVYFIDVGQGDGVLVRGPDGRHLLVDGGLPRSHQQSGKNAADFVDWKFFVDYGDLEIKLDAVVASHCDKDHYGGLDDLVSTAPSATVERDAVGIQVSSLFHAGISYWAIDESERAAFPDAPNDTKWLGPESPWDGAGRDELGSFRCSRRTPAKILTRLLTEDFATADVLDDTHHPHLAGDWQKFIGRCAAAGTESVQFAGLPFGAADERHFLNGWGENHSFQIRLLGPLTLEGPDGPALPDFGSTSQNTNGHSILLRLDYGAARILLTGDLNKNSMHYLLRGYAGHEDELKCDVAKACHHGSRDISFRFLEHVKAAATVISSGDSEGYGHPTPEVVGASAVTGFRTVDSEEDALLTPLIYSTEVERGVSLGAVKHLGFSAYPVDDDTGLDGTLFARRPSGSEARALYEQHRESNTSAEFSYTYFKGVWTRKTGRRKLDRARILDRVNYGLVNVRTDGELVMCATQTDAGGGWTTHAFPARFGAAAPD